MPSSPPLRVLIVDDDAEFAQLARDYLTASGLEVSVAVTPEEGLRRAVSGGIDVVVLDLAMPRIDGLAFLRRLPQGERPEIVVLSGGITVGAAVEAVKLGATDCLLKGGRLSELEAAVSKAGAARRSRDAARESLRATYDGTAPVVVTRSARMLEILSVLERVAASNVSVLLAGESGTGKDLLARTIHRQSPRSAGPFIDVNCAALSESLLEAELFGHEKGAFTGAISTRPGLAEAASGGTLFLDEIAEMSAPLQAKLLRMTEERTLYRVGGRQRIQVDIRIVAATNRDLGKEISAGRMREDLYYRLAGVEISVPPLRERPEDVEPLAYHYLRGSVTRGGRGPTELSPGALLILRSHTWPGNVRELRNVMERVALLATGRVVEPAQLGVLLNSRQASPAPLAPSLKELEREHIGRVLREEGWHHGRAAERLGMPLRTLYRRIKAYNLARPALPQNNVAS